MPTYVYGCSACNAEFEVVQRITENALDECHCGSKGTVRRLIQPVGVMFKGSGFHINDYAPKGSGDSVEAKPADAKPAETPAESCSGEPASCPTCSPPDA